MSFEPKYTQIKNLLHENTILEVPRYQRSYVWSDFELKNLFEDIMLNLTYNSDLGVEQRNHFIGSFIFEQNSLSWEIVDGQQRLTSLTILLVLISKQLRLLGFDNLSDAFGKYFFYVNNDNKYVVRLNNKSEFFTFFIGDYYKSANDIMNVKDFVEYLDLKFSKIDKMIITSTMFLEKQLEGQINKILSKEDKKEFLEKIRDTIYNLEGIQINAKQKDQGYTIFQILNSRGRPLVAHELLKSYIFRYMKITNVSDIASATWDEITENTEQENISNSSLDKFLTNYITHRFGKTKKDQEFDVILENTSKEEVKDLLLDLKEKSKIYSKITRAEGYSHSINYVLKFLNRNRISQFRPLLLTIFSKLKGTENQKKLEKIILTIKNFLFKYIIILKLKTNRLERHIYTYSKKLNDNFTDELMKEFFDLIYAEIPNTNDFTLNFTSLAYSKNSEWYPGIDVKQKSKISQILTELEIFYTSDDNKIPKDFTIEHIKDDSSKGNSCYIGNLTPLSSKDNKACNGKTLDEKLIIYKRSSYITTRKLAERLEKQFSNSGEYHNDTHINGSGTRLANVFNKEIWIRLI